jgi:RNA polymerase sigma-70 factor (ECF subfamily)
MDAADSFADFIRRVRAGDEQAAQELVRRFEPLIRREIRLEMEDRRLARRFDSMDVCQSVLLSFFVRAAAGQYELDRPEQLIKLLVAMARNKLASAARREHSQRRDQRRTTGDAAALDQVADAEPSPSQIVAGRELLEEFRRRLNPEEQQVSELRSQGLTWSAIAGQLGGTAQARRVQLSRAADRVLRELGLEEVRG